MPKTPPPMKLTTFKFPPSLLAELADASRALGATRGEIVRVALRRYLDERAGPIREFRRWQKRQGEEVRS